MPNCKVRITQPLIGVFPRYQPVVGNIYDATFRLTKKSNGKMVQPVCIISVSNKPIAIRKDEYEIVEMDAKEVTQ